LIAMPLEQEKKENLVLEGGLLKKKKKQGERGGAYSRGKDYVNTRKMCQKEGVGGPGNGTK